MHQEDDLRRIYRLHVCCRADVCDRFGVWTAVTEDISDRGCRLVATRSPRLGSILELTFTSDLFPESLEVSARVVWASSGRVGVSFLPSERRGPTPAEWVARVVEHGRVGSSGPRRVGAPRLVPVVESAPRDGASERGARVVPLRVKRG